MNKDILKIKKAQELTLSKEERETMWAAIQERGQGLLALSLFVENDSLKQDSPLVVSHWMFFQRKMLVSAAALLLVISGGVSVVAKDALPGDPLYVVKVNVNEKMQTLLAFSEKDKASVQAALAVKRLEEVKVLAESGNLDAKTEQGAKTRFAKHSQNLEQRLGNLEAKGDNRAVVQIGGKYEKNVTSAYETFVGLAHKNEPVPTAAPANMMAVPMAASSRSAYDSTEAASGTAMAKTATLEVENETTFKAKTRQIENAPEGLLGFAEEIRKASSKTSLLLHDSEEKLRINPSKEGRSRGRD